MFGLGMSELILLGVLALLLIGPQQLPEVARTLGRFINDLKRSADGLTDEIKKQAKADLDLDFLDQNRKSNEKSPPLKIWDPNAKKDNTEEQAAFDFNSEEPTEQIIEKKEDENKG